MPPKIQTMDDIKKKAAPNPDGSQSMYVGGGNSGGGVSATVIDESLLADKLKAQGAKSVEDHQREQAQKQKPKPFQGTGNSIHGTSVQAEPAAPASAPEKEHTLYLWRNGLSCDDGPLFPHSDPSVAQAVKEIEDGKVPRLFYDVLGRDPLVSIMSKQSEDYKAPEKPKLAFEGSGRSLGSGAAAAAFVPTAAAAQLPEVDSSQPTTQVAVTLIDGKRERMTLNQSFTVGTLYAYVSKFTPGVSFTLVGGVPPRPLTDNSATLASAGLLNAMVRQTKS